MRRPRGRGGRDALTVGGRHATSVVRRDLRLLPLFVMVLCLALVLATLGYLGGRLLAGTEGGPAVFGQGGAGDGSRGGDADEEPATAEQAAAQLEVPSAQTRMTDPQRIEGDISPKSVVANGNGLVIANNMMYNHTVTLYDAGSKELAGTVDDTVDMSRFGFSDFPGTTTGAPVEAAWTADGRYAYVSQYQLTGDGHGSPGNDDCRNGEKTGLSALYRLDSTTMQWDQVIQVGRVPKYVAISPDGSFALVSNWCDRTVSVVDLESGTETAQIPVDSAPRGIVILPDNDTAYVTAMYADELFRIDVSAGTSELVMETGDKPRHLVLSPDGSRMYLTEAGSDKLLEIDTAGGEVLREVATGREPRSMDISPDGSALYVVNYYENTVSKFDVASFTEVQRESVGQNPVGVAYEPSTASVWVANYAGSIDVFDDSKPADQVEAAEE